MDRSKKNDNTYAVLFKDGSFVEKPYLEELLHYTNIIGYLLIEFDHKHTTMYNNTYNWYRFKSINKELKSAVIEIDDNFQIVDIGPELGDYEDCGFKVKIYNISRSQVHDFRAKKGGLAAFKDEIIPFVNTLRNSVEAPNESDLQILKQRIDNLENKINQIESLLLKGK